MYKAIHLQTGEEIIILRPQWLRRIENLREMDRADQLVCQGCRQPLRVKAGVAKRPHFAHKHLKACSYGSESPELLNARAVLFDWLSAQFGGRVTLEKALDPTDRLPRPVDCWVETPGGCFAYWIFDAGVRLEPREAIHTLFEKPGVQAHAVFLHAMLNEKKQELYSLLLTPTERAFLQTTAYDALLAGPAGVGYSLHYLDADAGVLTTYRGLALIHRPNWYQGTRMSTPLNAVRAGPSDGEFAHPGEASQLESFLEKKRRLDLKRQQYAEREAAWAARLARWEKQGRRAGKYPSGHDERTAEPLPCATCGQITLDYWSTFFDERGRKLCRCRECLDRTA